MARYGLHKSEIKEARDLLLSQGRHPSVDAVRTVLGNTGSKTTIHKYLKELGKETGKTDDHQTQTARALQHLVEQLAAKLHADAEARIEEIRAEHAIALQRKNEEMEILQKQIDMLTARLQEGEAAACNARLTHDLHLEGIRSKPMRHFGLGFFGISLSTSRNGRPEQSLFNAILSGGRSTIDGSSAVRSTGYEIPSPI